MRVIHIVLLSLATSVLPATASAKAKPKVAEPEAAPSESAAARAVRLALAEDTGARRETDLRGASLAFAPIAQEASATERAPAPGTEATRSTAPLSGALEELVAKQRSRNENAFAHCVTEARSRDPQLAGDVELIVHVAEHHATAEVASDAKVDATFGACVATTARALKMSLPDLSFAWHVSLGHAAPSMASAAGSARAALP